LGHLFAAVLVGWKPVKLSLGRGKRWKTFKFGDFQIQLRLIPFGGFALSFPPNPTSFRVRKFLVAAGGPIATTLLALLLSLPLITIPDDDQAWRRPLTILFVGMCITVVENLFPHMVRVNGQKNPSDGLSHTLNGWRSIIGWMNPSGSTIMPSWLRGHQ
jgi:membrane-associated protease RseP (regulator of RpoE activity)